MEDEKIKIIYQDENLLAIEKPAGFVVFFEKGEEEIDIITILSKKFPELKKVGDPPRYGAIHRLDRDTSGILLIAKNNESFDFFKKQFRLRKVDKKYFALVWGEIKDEKGRIETLIGRSPKERKRQKAYLFAGPKAKRKKTALTEYKAIKRFKSYTLLEVTIKTGRKHQIRTHLSYLGYPVAGDKLYRFRKQVDPKNLKRQFLHAYYLKIKMPNGKEKEFHSEMPDDLKKVIQELSLLE
jgi:23S rRNA pseudouridine1911/1915/1917 synthase